MSSCASSPSSRKKCHSSRGSLFSINTFCKCHSSSICIESSLSQHHSSRDLHSYVNPFYTTCHSSSIWICICIESSITEHHSPRGLHSNTTSAQSASAESLLTKHHSQRIHHRKEVALGRFHWKNHLISIELQLTHEQNRIHCLQEAC